MKRSAIFSPLLLLACLKRKENHYRELSKKNKSYNYYTFHCIEAVYHMRLQQNVWFLNTVKL